MLYLTHRVRRGRRAVSHLDYLCDACREQRSFPIAGMGGEHSMQLVCVTQRATAEAGMCSNVPAIKRNNLKCKHI
jgi:hypothetical protein